MADNAPTVWPPANLLDEVSHWMGEDAFAEAGINADRLRAFWACPDEFLAELPPENARKLAEIADRIYRKRNWRMPISVSVDGYLHIGVGVNATLIIAVSLVDDHYNATLERVDLADEGQLKPEMVAVIEAVFRARLADDDDEIWLEARAAAIAEANDNDFSAEMRREYRSAAE